MKKNFAVIGCAGYVAPRHLQAIKETGNKLIAALDKSDSVGVLDKYFDDVDFFTEFERFDRHAEKLRRRGENEKIHYVSICSPNYLHDAHTRFAFRIGADAICEKPLATNPWTLDGLEELERETGKKVYTVMQLRLHPTLIELKKKIDECESERGKKYDVKLAYITPRGKWYQYSWKGNMEKAGGLAINLGIHSFDMLLWMFGGAINSEVLYSDNYRCAGNLELERARVQWYLSIDKKDLSQNAGKSPSYRSLKIDGEQIEYSDGFTNLHTEVYKKILNGEGIGIQEARPSIKLAYDIVNSKPVFNSMVALNREGDISDLIRT